MQGSENQQRVLAIIMTRILAHATPADVPRIAQLETEIFSPWPVYVALFPHGATLSRKLVVEARYHHLLANDPSTNLLKVTDESTGTIIAAALWNVYTHHRDEAELVRDSQFDWSPDAPLLEACLKYSRQLFDSRKRDLGGKPHCLLRWLVTAPEYRKNGAATQLITWGSKKADELGILCYLEASDEGKPVYEKHGYVEAGELVLDIFGEDGKKMSGGKLMIRQPVAQKQ